MAHKYALTGHRVYVGAQLPSDAVRWVERPAPELTPEEKAAGVSIVDVDRGGQNNSRWIVRRVIVARQDEQTPAAGTTAPEEPRYLIADGLGGWFRAPEQGVTQNRAEAHRYTLALAYKTAARNRGSVRPIIWPEDNAADPHVLEGLQRSTLDALTKLQALHCEARDLGALKLAEAAERATRELDRFIAYAEGPQGERGKAEGEPLPWASAPA